jgi:hypothetical protein
MATRNKQYLSGSIEDNQVFNNLMKYERNIDNSLEVFTYEMGKYFKGMSWWCVNPEDKSINFEYDELNCSSIEDVFERVIELAGWLQDVEVA